MDASLIQFRDNSGRVWQVWEVGERLFHSNPGISTGEYPRVQPTGWLCFESTGERRRLSAYPYRWYKLPQDRLEQLCERAVPARIPSYSPKPSDSISGH